MAMVSKDMGVVHEKAQVVLPLLVDFFGNNVNVLKVRTKDLTLVHLSDLENKGSGLVEPKECGFEKVVFDGLVGAFVIEYVGDKGEKMTRFN